MGWLDAAGDRFELFLRGHGQGAGGDRVAERGKDGAVSRRVAPILLLDRTSFHGSVLNRPASVGWSFFTDSR